MKDHVSFRFTAAHEVAAHTNAMLAYWDSNLVCRYANDAYLEWFGHTPAEMIGKMTLPQLLGEVLYQKNKVYIDAALQGKVQVFERDITTVVGELRNGLATYNPDIVDGKVAGFFVHVADITQLKGRQPGNGNDPKTANHVPADSPDDILNAVEKTLRSHLFLPFPGISFLAKKHHISSSKLKRDFKRKYRRTIFSYFRHLQMEVAEIYIEEKKHSKKEVAELLKFANPSNFLNVYKKYLRDKSAKKLIDDLEKSTDDRYKIFISQSPVAIAMFDKKMNLMAASHKWVVDFELKDRIMNGINFYEFFPGARERWEGVNKKCLEGEINQGEEMFTRVDGSDLWLRWDIRCWLNAKNEPGGIIVFAEDITLATQQQADNKRLLEILLKTSEVTRIGVWERNFLADTVYWNEVTYDILEVPSSELPPRQLALHLYTDPAEREKISHYIDMARHHGQSFDFIAAIKTFKGRSKTIRVVGFSEMKEGVCERLYGIIKEINKT